MTDDKTQRERDLDYARDVHNLGVPFVADAIAEAREHGRRDSDTWRAAMREAAMREAARTVLAHDWANTRGLLVAKLRELGTEPPRTYEDGLREAARLLAEAAGATSNNRKAGLLWAWSAEFWQRAGSTPPATPSALGGQDSAVGALPLTRERELHDSRERPALSPGATPPEQPRSAAPPGDARARLVDLIAALDATGTSGSLCRGALESLDRARTYLASTPEAPPRTAAEEWRDVLAYIDEFISWNPAAWNTRVDTLTALRARIEASAHVGAAARAKGGKP